MRWPMIALLLTTVGVVQAQVAYPPTTVAAAPDLSGYATKGDVASVQSLASSAMTKATNAVQSVNGQTGVVTVTQPDLSPYALKAQVPTTAAMTSAIAGITFPVTSVNGLGGAVSVPLYTDAMAVAANAPAITSATAAAAAAARESVQVVVPATGAAVSTNTGTTLLFVNNAALLSALTITFPGSPVDGQRFTVAANNAITVLSFTGATGRGLLTTISANGYARYAYSASVGAWLRTG